MKTLTSAIAILGAFTSIASAQNPIDRVRPDAPELAQHGPHPIGVRTMSFNDTGRIDVINTPADGDIPRADRDLTVEIWYPAAEGTTPGETYTTVLRDGETKTTISGMASRDATPAEGSFPLVIISHGYPGNRFLMSHLGENLATKGYVTVSIDHADSTYSDLGAFNSTLVNRPLDQRFILNSMAGLDNEIGAITDAENAAVIGYSMGGYGALIFGGAGLSEEAVSRTEPERYVAPQQLLARNQAGSDSHTTLIDPRIKAVIAVGPWGRNRDFWDADGLAQFEKPLMLIAGDQDDVSEYDAIREIFSETTGTTRHLLSFHGANHNAAAPMPAPDNSWDMSEKLGWAPFGHYADAVWDTTRMNNVFQHFATAYLDLHLKGQEARAVYLDLVERAEDGVWAMDDDGNPKPEHSYWTGFPNRSAKSLRFETLVAE